MASSEGIALLSIYGDDEEDDDMEQHHQPVPMKQHDSIIQQQQSVNSVGVGSTTTPDLNEKVNLHGMTEQPEDFVPAEEQNLLEKFLPPQPKDKCSDVLQEKIIKFLALKKTTGRSFNAEVRNRKEYRNPDFLLHAVTYQDIDHIGSSLFDPHGYHKSDFYDQIEADMRREINLPIPGMAPVAAVDSVTRDGRLNKKSKWDMVDVDRRETVSSVGAHAALLSAANDGSGYTAFAQQRRREAEEKRPSDKKLDRRS